MIRRLDANHRMSQVVIYPLTGSMVVLSGQVTDDKSLNTVEQTQNILDKIDRYMAEAGVGKEDLVSVNIWLTDMSEWSAMNVVWDKWINGGPAPARACVGAVLADKGYKVEIQVFAHKA